MPKKYSFPELECHQCEHFQRIGDDFMGTRYCGGFPRKRKPKRFSSSDPQYKAPKWCPRRISPPVCRIYGFADEQSRFMELLNQERFDPKREQYIFPNAGHYKLFCEMNLGMKAKAFFDKVSRGSAFEVLSEHGIQDIQLGEVIEIDDGLKPYYFYYLNWSKVVPVMLFDRTRVQKGD